MTKSEPTILDPGRPIIDPHHHLWDRSRLALGDGPFTDHGFSEMLRERPRYLLDELLIFGAVFAVNSSLHSYLILTFTKAERVTMDVGFYYMANAGGRLAGTLLSGLTYQAGGLALMLGTAAGMVAASSITVGFLKPENTQT